MHTALRRKILISYAQQDKDWLDRLRDHLRPLERASLLESWDETRIQPGQVREQMIAAALAEARVVVILVSKDYLASDVLIEKELPCILKAAEGGDVTLIPVIIGHCSVDAVPALARIKPVSLLGAAPGGIDSAKRSGAPSIDKAMVELAQTLLSSVGNQATAPSEATSTACLALESLDDSSCRLLANELLENAVVLLGQASPVFQMTLPRLRRVLVEVNQAALRDSHLVQSLRQELELIHLIENRLNFLRQQQNSMYAAMIDFSVEARSKEADLASEVRDLRRALVIFVDQIRALP